MNDLTACNVKKVKGIIKLILANGSNVVLKDKGIGTDDVDKKEYHLKGMLLNKFYVVLANDYETGEFLLIDKNDGLIVKLWGEPYTSPDKSHIASFSGSLDYDMQPNGIQLYKIDHNNISLDWEYKITDWQPEDIAWKNNKTLIVLKVVPDYISPTKKNIKNYLELSF